MNSDMHAWIVLDVDDTLLDTVTNGFEKVRLAARQMGLRELTQTKFDALYGAVPFEECVRRWFPEVDVPEFARRYGQLTTEVPYAALCDGPELLAAIADSGLRPAVLTNGPAWKTERKLGVLGLVPADFDAVLCGDEGPRKPTKAAFERLIGHGIDPRRSWYVSDDRNDWVGAAQAGLRTLAVVNARRRQHRPPTGLPALPNAVVAASPSLHRVMSHLSAALAQPVVRRPPEAVFFDAGFTIITDRCKPIDLVREATARPEVTADNISRAMATHQHLLKPWIWRSEAACEEALCAFYEGVLRDLAAPGDSSASALLAAYVAPTNWSTLPGVEPVLDQLVASGLRLNVFSNWQSSLPETIAAAGLGQFFEACVSSVVLRTSKPSPDSFLEAARVTRADPTSSVYVGDDSATDFAALAAGFTPVLIDPTVEGALLAPSLAAALDRNIT